MYNENEGPDFYNDNGVTHAKIIEDGYTFGPWRNDKGEMNSFDYYYMATIDGMKYYTPNNEDWGPIIVIDEEGKLAESTGFYEMDDMEYKDSDYRFVRFGGKLVPHFTIPAGSIYNVTINGEA